MGLDRGVVKKETSKLIKRGREKKNEHKKEMLQRKKGLHSNVLGKNFRLDTATGKILEVVLFGPLYCLGVYHLEDLGPL